MKIRLTLRSRLIMLMVAAMVPLFGLSMVKSWRNQQAAVSRATGDLTFAAALVAANQDRVVDSARQMLVSIVNAPGLVSGKTADCQRYFKTVKEQFLIYGDMGIIGLDGHFLCRSEDNAPGVFLGDRDYFQAALARRGFVGGGYVQSRVTGKSIVLFAMPIMNSEASPAAVAFLSMDLSEMSKTVTNAALPKGSRIVVMDRQGVVLTTSSPNPDIVGRQVPGPVLQEAVKTMRPGTAEGLDAQGHQRVYSFLPAGQASDAAFFVAVSVDRDGVLAPARQQLKLELAVLALVHFWED